MVMVNKGKLMMISGVEPGRYEVGRYEVGRYEVGRYEVGSGQGQMGVAAVFSFETPDRDR